MGSQEEKTSGGENAAARSTGNPAAATGARPGMEAKTPSALAPSCPLSPSSSTPPYDAETVSPRAAACSRQSQRSVVGVVRQSNSPRRTISCRRTSSARKSALSFTSFGGPCLMKQLCAMCSFELQQEHRASCTQRPASLGWTTFSPEGSRGQREHGRPIGAWPRGPAKGARAVCAEKPCAVEPRRGVSSHSPQRACRKTSACASVTSLSSPSAKRMLLTVRGRLPTVRWWCSTPLIISSKKSSNSPTVE